MSEPVDVYCDQFQVTIGPYGSALSFMLSSPTPPAPGSAPPAERMASVRMSLEHLKVMTFMIRQQILKYERDSGISIQVPRDVLNNLRIGPEDWEALWKP